MLRFFPVVLVHQSFSGGKNMSIIATVASVGTALMTLAFSLWMIKQLFTNH